MADSFLIDNIRTTIENSVKPCFHNTSLTELYVMCPECGHTSHKGSAHYYIAMVPPFKTYCQKCGKKGALNHNTLEELGIYNNELELMIKEANKDVTGKTSYSVSYFKPKSQIFDYSDDDDARTQLSVDYVNKRFNSEFTIDELNNRFKCVANPAKYLQSKRIDVSRYKFNFDKAIGFVSSDNQYLICRDISGEQEMRYSNVPLSNDKKSSKIYSIRMPNDRLNPKSTLVITEGIFDAIGVYNAFYKDSENVIIAAGCGKSFEQVIDKYKRLGYLNLDIVIYSDSDVNISMYKKIKLTNKMKEKITVYYNSLGKDTGVSPDKIKLVETII